MQSTITHVSLSRPTEKKDVISLIWVTSVLLTACADCKHFNPASISSGQMRGDLKRRLAMVLTRGVVTVALTELGG